MDLGVIAAGPSMESAIDTSPGSSMGTQDSTFTLDRCTKATEQPDSPIMPITPATPLSPTKPFNGASVAADRTPRSMTAFDMGDFRRFSGRNRKAVQKLGMADEASLKRELDPPKDENPPKKPRLWVTKRSAPNHSSKSGSVQISGRKMKRKRESDSSVMQVDSEETGDGTKDPRATVLGPISSAPGHDNKSRPQPRAKSESASARKGTAIPKQKPTRRRPTRMPAKRPDINTPTLSALSNAEELSSPSGQNLSWSQFHPPMQDISRFPITGFPSLSDLDHTKNLSEEAVGSCDRTDTRERQRLLDMSREIMYKLPIDQKPRPFGSPSVWSSTRQALCETLLYYQAWQSACYISKGVLYSFMFDGNSHPRDLIDGDVIIARAGGGMVRDDTGEMQQTKSQTENSQTRAVRSAIASQNPIIILCGNENADVPTKMPHRYQVLGWYKPTHVWAEQHISSDKTWVNYKYRFEKLQCTDESWWLPDQHPHAGPDLDVVPSCPLRSVKVPLQGGFVYEDACMSAAGVTDIADYDQLDLRRDSACDIRVRSYIKVGTVEPPIRRKCPSCFVPNDQVYLCGWLCLNADCVQFWLLEHGRYPQESDLQYDPRFVKQFTRWACEKAPYNLRPALPDPSSRLGESFSFAMTRGMCCPQCGKCVSRSKWYGWLCTCGFSHKPPHPVIPSSLLKDPWHPAERSYAQVHDTADSRLHTSVQFSNNYKIVTYMIPGLEGCSVSHLIANQTVREEARGPDDMFEKLQASDCGLERRRFVTGKEEYMTAFSNNRGMPYKFVASGECSSFEGAPWPMTETRSRLNWAANLVLGDSFTRDQEFNELLTIGYFDGQNIKYHDDGEAGLGDTVASLSLGFPADMWFRVKAKHWSGVSKGGQFVDQKPLPGTLRYAERLQAWTDLHSMPSGIGSKADHMRRLAEKLGLQDNTRERKPWLRLRLGHGDIVVMHGQPIQEYLEHQVDPLGTLRFALTCRTILPDHLKENELPAYRVLPDDWHYTGAAIAELRDISGGDQLVATSTRDAAASGPNGTIP